MAFMFGFRKKSAEKSSRRGLSRLGKFFAVLSVVAVLAGAQMSVKPQKAEAFSVCIPCMYCGLPDILVAAIIVYIIKEIFAAIIEENIEDHINGEKVWIVQDFFRKYWVKGLAELTRFLSVSGIYQVEMVGTFFDAKNQLETKRLFNQMVVEAHKDYHPSEGICAFGTNTRSLASTEQRSVVTKSLLSKRSLARHLASQGTLGEAGLENEIAVRWQKFVRTNCDPNDNAPFATTTSAAPSGLSGLALACDRDGPGGSTASGAVTYDRKNRDIDFTRLIETPRTLTLNFADVHPPASVPADEEDVLSMSMNLYGHQPTVTSLSRKALQTEEAQNLYMALRSVIAKRSVAQNSFNAIVAIKSAGTAPVAPAGNVSHFMAAAFRDMMPPTTTEAEIYAILGENPSYFAQLEFLSKKLYQSPKFFADLYDKPVNVERKSVAMKAVELMLDRALYESELRQEMVLSVLLSSELNVLHRKTNRDLVDTKGSQ